MNYDFRYGTATPISDLINEILDTCDKLNADDKATIFDYGVNGNLVLHIYKDSDYNREIDENEFNIVRMSTYKDGVTVDDTEDIHVSDNVLIKELERIWNEKDFSTL